MLNSLRPGYLTCIAVSLLLLCIGTGCATAVRGDQQKIKFRTDPTGASVQIAAAPKAGTREAKAPDTLKDPAVGTFTTPVEVKLKRSRDYRVVISKPGFQSLAFTMTARFDGVSLAGAPLPGGSALMATDRVTGADLAFWTLPVIKLTPASAAPAQATEMYQYKNDLLTKEQYDKAIKEEVEAEVMRDRT